ncbi:hypothetical protein OROMI_028794 [Orobanche minor]
MIHHKEHTLVVGSLVPSTSDSDLKDAFEKFGHLVSAKSSTSRTNGLVSVHGTDKSAMEAAIQEMDEAELGGKFITFTIVRPGFGRPREMVPKGVYRVRFFWSWWRRIWGILLQVWQTWASYGMWTYGKKVSSSGRYGGRVDSVKPRYLTDENRTRERHGSSERGGGGGGRRSRDDGGSRRGSTYTRHRPGPHQI